MRRHLVDQIAARKTQSDLLCSPLEIILQKIEKQDCATSYNSSLIQNSIPTKLACKFRLDNDTQWEKPLGSVQERQKTVGHLNITVRSMYNNGYEVVILDKQSGKLGHCMLENCPSLIAALALVDKALIDTALNKYNRNINIEFSYEETDVLWNALIYRLDFHKNISSVERQKLTHKNIISIFENLKAIHEVNKYIHDKVLLGRISAFEEFVNNAPSIAYSYGMLLDGKVTATLPTNEILVVFLSELAKRLHSQVQEEIKIMGKPRAFDEAKESLGKRNQAIALADRACDRMARKLLERSGDMLPAHMQGEASLAIMKVVVPTILRYFIELENGITNRIPKRETFSKLLDIVIEANSARVTADMLEAAYDAAGMMIAEWTQTVQDIAAEDQARAATLIDAAAASLDNLDLEFADFEVKEREKVKI